MPKNLANLWPERLPEIRDAVPWSPSWKRTRFHPALAEERVKEALGVSTPRDSAVPRITRPFLPLPRCWPILVETQHIRPSHLDRLKVDEPGRTLALDTVTRRKPGTRGQPAGRIDQEHPAGAFSIAPGLRWEPGRCGPCCSNRFASSNLCGND